MKLALTHFERLTANDIIPGMRIGGSLVLSHDHSKIIFDRSMEIDFHEVDTIKVIKEQRKFHLSVEVPKWEAGDAFLRSTGEQYRIEWINANIFYFSISGRTNNVRMDILEVEDYLRENKFTINRSTVEIKDDRFW